MEKQNGAYEEKALAAIQRATHDKAEAFSKTETLQVGPHRLLTHDRIPV